MVHAAPLCDPGDIVLVEDPTHFVFLGIVQSHGVLARGVRLERGGIDLGHMEQVLEELKRAGSLPRLQLFYTVSYHQNPTSTTTSYEKKAAALDLLRRYEGAAGHPIYLLEDAAYRELRFCGSDVRSALAARGRAKRVIYVGTYSKPFATGVRVGFGLLPEPVLRTALCIKANHDFGSTSLLQHLLARALETGAYDRIPGDYSIQGFGMRIHPVLGIWRMHEGVDIIADVGTPVYAAANGTVRFSGRTSGGYGSVIEISHGYGYTTLYAHMSKVYVTPGKSVERGELIGRSGRSGLVSGPHLHYEVKHNGRKMDPVDFFFDDVDPTTYRSQFASTGRP